MNNISDNRSLLKFLFEDSQEDAVLDGYLDVLNEEYDAQERLKTKKTPLQKALKVVGVTGGMLNVSPEQGGYVLVFDVAVDQKKAIEALQSPDGMHKLAELGWLATNSGDTDGTGSDGKFEINLIEITGDDEPSDKELPPDLSKSDYNKIAKDSYEFVHDDPEAREDIKPTSSTKGVGKISSGDTPKSVKETAMRELKRRLT